MSSSDNKKNRTFFLVNKYVHPILQQEVRSRILNTQNVVYMEDKEFIKARCCRHYPSLYCPKTLGADF